MCAWAVLTFFPGKCTYIFRVFEVIVCKAKTAGTHEYHAVLKAVLIREKHQGDNDMERNVRTSAKALVIKDGFMLAVKINDNGEEFYIMPGGGQRAGELLQDTCRREVAEETGIDVEAKDAVFIIEGSEGEPFHRVDIVFLCEYLGKADAEHHGDSNQAGYEWIKIEDLNKAPLYPSKLRRPIMNLYEGKSYPIYLGNECAGDPEITD